MDIDTGDHPPICLKPYTLALKHYEWVQKEVEQLERTVIITRSISPWASPIVIVLDKFQEPKSSWIAPSTVLLSIWKLCTHGHRYKVCMTQFHQFYTQQVGVKV